MCVCVCERDKRETDIHTVCAWGGGERAEKRGGKLHFREVTYSSEKSSIPSEKIPLVKCRAADGETVSIFSLRKAGGCDAAVLLFC